MKIGYLIHAPRTLATLYRTRRRGQFKILESQLSNLTQSQTRGFKYLSQPDFSPLEGEFEKMGQRAAQVPGSS